jgi:hypothetical protein
LQHLRIREPAQVSAASTDLSQAVESLNPARAQRRPKISLARDAHDVAVGGHVRHEQRE